MARPMHVPTRAEVKPEHTWDLTPLFSDPAAWEKALQHAEKMLPQLESFRGTLHEGAETLRKLFDLETQFGILFERVAEYAHLRYNEDLGNPEAQAMVARCTHLAGRVAEATSYIAPEIQAIPDERMERFLADPCLKLYRLKLERLLRYKPHVLTPEQERLLAMQTETAETPSKVFGQLMDADLRFGTVTDEKGNRVEITHSSLRVLLESPSRAVRRKAFFTYYGQIEKHANTLAATLAGSVLQDVYYARVRNFASAREASLFADNVPTDVYGNLIAGVRRGLPALHEYYELRRRVLGLRDIHMYDIFVPLVARKRVHIPYEQAVATLCEAMAPLGADYVEVLRAGLLEKRWVDRYENRGKRSGAFSSAAYRMPPYILMNYRAEVLDSVFTLAHEAGHSMHSYFSHRKQPYPYAHYTIFVAEVASTFNEQLLSAYLLDRARTKAEKAVLISRELDEIRGTIYRQTMFAEFEHRIHAAAEAGTPLTLQYFREEYDALLRDYFGPKFRIDPELQLESLRIPHFYHAFYVYKYAIGLSAAIVLAERVRSGDAVAVKRYLRFLESGSTKWPLEQLRDAGVDMTRPEPLEKALNHFAQRVEELGRLL